MNEGLNQETNTQNQSQFQEQLSFIEGFKGIFFSAFFIDLEKNFYRQIFLKQRSAKHIKNKEGIAEILLNVMSEKLVAPETRESMIKFNDLSTLAERLGDKGSLSQDYIGIENGWCRATVIPIEKDESGKVTRIIYGTSNIQSDFVDPLTKCNKRKALNWAYDSNNKSKNSIAVILCDINGIKSINDTQGREAGDQYIIKAANLYADCFGISNVYRIEGDKFAIVIVGGAKEVIGRRVLDFKKQCEDEGVSVSLGYEFRAEFNESFEKIYKACEAKLLSAKRDFYKNTELENSFSEYAKLGEYFESLIDFGSSCYMVWRVDILNNSFKIVRAMEGYDTSFLSECKTLKDILYYPVTKNNVYREDVKDYERWIENHFSNNPETIKKQAGRKETWFRYRSNYNKKNFRITEVQYFPGRNFSEDNQYGYVYLKDKGNLFEDGNMYFEEVLKNLSDNYESIFYIKLDSEEVYPYRISHYIADSQAVKLAKEGKIFEGIENYIDNYVAPSDRVDMHRICARSFLEEQLKVKKAFSRDYLAYIDGNEVYYRIKFANMDGAGSLKHIAVAFENINSEIIHKKAFKIRGSSILVVEDSEINRILLKEILEPKYKVLEAKDGEEAQRILSEKSHEISLVITDLEMPNCNGFELIKIMQQNSFYKKLPVIVATAYDDVENKSRCFEMGAIDFITKPYNAKLIVNRVSSLLRLKGLAEDTRLNEIDALTGLYDREAFYRYSQTIIDSNPNSNYVISISDVIGFKAINEQYGKDKGDELLKFLAEKIKASRISKALIGGRLGGDVIATLVPEDFIRPEAAGLVIADIQSTSPVPNIVIKFGFYYTKDGKELSVQQMCDRASLALNSIKSEYGVHCAKYDETMWKNLLLEQQIVDGMKTALEEEQFEVYFQPKHSVDGKGLSGAETLVRWIHPEMGFMNPGTFIPLFEKNGFITKLDKFVWKKACEEIAYWVDQGSPFPISVNVSRKDFSDPQLAEYILDLTNEYNIPHELLHIEITESAYSDNPEQLKNIVGMLHSNGFVIELDDFGTGYSSLTAINSFKIDIIKLDMSLIKNDAVSQGNSVLEFSIQLAKMMNVMTIQEGVETEAEYNRMKKLGCDYIQGYYFSKPLPKKEFDEYVRQRFIK